MFVNQRSAASLEDHAADLGPQCLSGTQHRSFVATLETIQKLKFRQISLCVGPFLGYSGASCHFRYSEIPSKLLKYEPWDGPEDMPKCNDTVAL